MTKITGRMLTLLLSFSMVFTSIGWLGVSEVNAAVDNTVLYVQVKDGDTPVKGVQLELEYHGSDQNGEYENINFDDLTDDNGIASYEIDNNSESVWDDDYYLIKIKGETGYTYDDAKVVFSADGSDTVVGLINGEAYSATAEEPFVLSVSKQAAESVDYVAMQVNDKTSWGELGISYDAIDDSYVILDVRPDAKWEAGHLKGSVHVDVTKAESLTEDGKYIAENSDAAKGIDMVIASADPSKKIVIICNGGQTLAARAMQYINTAHFDGKGVNENITYLIGGAGVIPAEDMVTEVDYVKVQKNAAEWDKLGIGYNDIDMDKDFILDVRPDANWDSGRLAGAKHVNVALSDEQQVLNGYVVADSQLAKDLDAAYEAAGDKRIVVVCVRGQVLAARTLQYYNAKNFNNAGVDEAKVTYLQGGATAFPEEGRVKGAEKARTMTTTIDMSKYEKGKVVKVWVPVPQTEDYQVISNEKFEAKTAKVAEFTTESVNGNKMLYLEWAADAEPADRIATLSFDAKRDEMGNKVLLQRKDDTYPEDVQEYITKESEMVKVNDPIVKKYAEIAVGDNTATLDKAKAIYDWEVANLERIDNGETLTNKDGATREFKVEGCGYGDTVKILTDFDEFGRAGGHCTDLNSTFVALCRANGIPAREMFGIRMNDDATGGQHCWAEFYLPGTGWVFADPGDALKSIKSKKGMTVDEVAAAKAGDTFAQKKAYFWGTVDENRIVLSRGRDITFNPPQAWGKCNTFGYPAAEVGGERNPADFTDAKNFVYSIACTEVKESTPEPAPAPAPAITDGQTAVVDGATVQVLSASAKTAVYVKAPNKKNVTVPATVSVNSQTLDVTQIGPKAFTGKKIRTVTIGKNVSKIMKNAFKGSKATKMIVKSKKLKKASVKGSLKGSKIKTVQVKVGKKKVNKQYVKKYKKIFTKKNAGRKVVVK